MQENVGPRWNLEGKKHSDFLETVAQVMRF